MTLGLAIIGGIVAIVAIEQFAETVKNKKVRRAELEEIRQDISQIKTDIGDMKERSFRLYQWGRDGRWTATRGTDSERLRSVEAYISKQTPLRKASALTDADAERLRALGYVDVEKDAPSDGD